MPSGDSLPTAIESLETCARRPFRSTVPVQLPLSVAKTYRLKLAAHRIRNSAILALTFKVHVFVSIKFLSKALNQI